MPSEQTQQKNFRLQRDAIQRLEAVAEIGGVSHAEALRECLPSASVLELYRWSHTAGLALSYAPWLAGLVAKGARAEMLGHPEFPIAEHFLRGQSADFVLTYYADWLACVDAKRGIKSVDGQPVEWRLEPVPDTSAWREAGVVGWALLRKNERFTANGIERGVRDD